MEDREYAAVARGVKEFITVPTGGERSSLGFAIADDAIDNQVRVVEGGPVRMAQGVAQFPALVDAAGCFRGDVAGDAARKAKLLEQLLDAFRVLADVRIDLAVSAFQISV